MPDLFYRSLGEHIMSIIERRTSPGPDVVTCELDDGLVVLCLRRKMYYNLDAPGRVIWEALDRGMRVESATEALSKEFAVDSDTAQQDTIALVSSLVDAGLIEFETSGADA